MICPTCNKESIVTDSRLVDGVRYRRRKCDCLKLWSTAEVLFDGPWPYKDSRVRTRKYKPKPKVKPKPKKEYLPVFKPAVQEWNIVVTKKSPLWLRNIAMQLQ
jgi:hypothetical protein